MFGELLKELNGGSPSENSCLTVEVKRKVHVPCADGKNNITEKTFEVNLMFKDIQFMCKSDYHKEWEYTEMHEPANMRIAELTVRLKGNTLLLFDHTEHGNSLFGFIRSDNKHFIDGTVDIEDREDIRKIIENTGDAILVGNVKCVGTGINIKRINNIIFSSGGKGLVKVIQAIGRGLRMHELKDRLNLVDISFNKKYSQLHFMSRLRLYRKFYQMSLEKIHEINLMN